MDSTDVRWDYGGYGPGDENQFTAFPSGGDQQVCVGAGRIKGFWILCNAGNTLPDTFDDPPGACFVDFRDGFSDTEELRDASPLILRIGVGIAGVEGLQSTARFNIPGNGLKYNTGLWIKSTPIDTYGTFYQMALFTARAGIGSSDTIVYP